MVRGVVVVIFTIMLVGVGLLVGVSVIEPLSEEVKSYDSIDEGPLEGSSVIDDVQRVVFEYMPLLVIGGIVLWAFRWYLRRERFVRGR